MEIKNIKLPEKFELKNNGQYGNCDLKWICQPKVLIKEDKSIEDKNDLYIFYDDSYKPIKGIDGTGRKTSKQFLNKTKSLFNFDPRYILKNGKQINLKKYGIIGDGFLIEETNSIYRVCKFDDELNFTTFMFLKIDNRIEEAKDQRFIYKIKPIL